MSPLIVKCKKFSEVNEVNEVNESFTLDIGALQRKYD